MVQIKTRLASKLTIVKNRSRLTFFLIFAIKHAFFSKIDYTKYFIDLNPENLVVKKSRVGKKVKYCC